MNRSSDPKKESDQQAELESQFILRLPAVSVNYIFITAKTT